MKRRLKKDQEKKAEKAKKIDEELVTYQIIRKTEDQLLMDKLLKAMKEHLGLIKYAVEACKTNRAKFVNLYNTYPDFRAKIDDIYEDSIDHVENALYKKINEGDTQAIMFYLKNKGGRRGYGNFGRDPERKDLNIVVNFDR